MSDLVSVCINTYNSHAFIMETIESVLSQTHKNIELILTDDCSNDDTPNILRSYEKKHSFIRVKMNPLNLGISKNVNQAVSRAAGEYCLLLGHDDLLPPEHIEIMLKGFTDENIGLVHCNAEIINSKGERTGAFKRSSNAKQAELTQDALAALCQDNFIQSCGMVFRRELFLLSGGWEEQYKFFGEWLWYIKMLKHCKFAYCAETSAFYRIHESNISRQINMNSAYSLLLYKLRCMFFALRLLKVHRFKRCIRTCTRACILILRAFKNI